MTIQSLSLALNEALETATRTSGDKFYKLSDGSPTWMTDVIRAVHGDKLPDDTVYEVIENVSAVLSYLDEDANYDSAIEAVYEIEACVYTSDLTAWLHRRVDHVEYLSEVLEEFGGDIKDGFYLLACAQKKQIDEIGCALVSELNRMAEEEETE